MNRPHYGIEIPLGPRKSERWLWGNFTDYYWRTRMSKVVLWEHYHDDEQFNPSYRDIRNAFSIGRYVRPGKIKCYLWNGDEII